MAAPTTSPQAVLDKIQSQRDTAPLSISTLAEPITNSHIQPSQQDANSAPPAHDTSLTPSTLASDLTHYRDLFSKLRFSYLEQVTKEKYLRSIVGELPTIATSEDNEALELRLAVMKEELQAKKRGVEGLVGEIEELAREVGGRWDRVEEGRRRLETVPGEVEELEREVVEMRRLVAEREGEGDVEDGGERMQMGMEETRRAVEEQEAENERLRKLVEELQREMPGKMRECERTEKELEELEQKRNEITRQVMDARRRKEEGGRDVLEEQGRWYQSSEAVLRGMLGVAGTQTTG